MSPAICIRKLTVNMFFSGLLLSQVCISHIAVRLITNLDCIKVLRISIGTGKMTVELFSAEILFRVCK